jgi:hypothetical protein
MTSLGLPFQGACFYWVEASFNGGVSGTTLAISAKVLDARIALADKHKRLRGIDSPNACHLLKQCNDYTFHVEYIPQCGDTLMEDVISRGTDCQLQSLVFQLNTNKCLSSADQSNYLLSGCKPKTIRISSSKNTEYVVVIDFSFASVSTSGATHTAPSTPTGAFCAFNIAGSIQSSVGGDLAYITNSIDITIDQGINDYYDHDSIEKKFIIEGELNIDATCDISLDEGGSAHLADVLAQTDFNVTVNMGAAGCPKLTLNNCKWKTFGADVNISGEAMMESAPFTPKSISVATV